MLTFFAYRRWMDATSSRNAEPPRIIPDDGGCKEISVWFHWVAVRATGLMSEIWERRRSRKLAFSNCARMRRQPQGRLKSSVFHHSPLTCGFEELEGDSNSQPAVCKDRSVAPTAWWLMLSWELTLDVPSSQCAPVGPSSSRKNDDLSKRSGLSGGAIAPASYAGWQGRKW